MKRAGELHAGREVDCSLKLRLESELKKKWIQLVLTFLSLWLNVVAVKYRTWIVGVFSLLSMHWRVFPSQRRSSQAPKMRAWLNQILKVELWSSSQTGTMSLERWSTCSSNTYFLSLLFFPLHFSLYLLLKWVPAPFHTERWQTFF